MKKQNEKRTLKIRWALVFVPAIIIIMLAYIPLRLNYNEVSKRFDGGRIEFETTTANWQRSYEIAKSEDEKKAFDYYVDEYTYQVNDHIYTGVDEVSIDKKNLRDLTSYKGTETKIYFNPENPLDYSFEQISFASEMRKMTVVSVICGAVVIAFTLIMYLVERKRLVRTR